MLRAFRRLPLSAGSRTARTAVLVPCNHVRGFAKLGYDPDAAK
jgi:hypothetical protein